MSAEKIESRENLLRMLDNLGKRERHIGEVIFCIYERGMSCVEAYGYVAGKFDVKNQTVRSKIYRDVGLEAAQFDAFLKAGDWVGLFQRIEHTCPDAPVLRAFFQQLQDEPAKLVIGEKIPDLSDMTPAERRAFILNLLEELENDQ